MRSSSRWQWLSVQLTSGRHREAREERRRPSRPATRPGTRPSVAASGSRWSATEPLRPMRRHISSAAWGIGGRREHRHDAQHLERVAEHPVDLRSRLGLPRLGGLELGVGRPDEPPRRLERLRRLRRAPMPTPAASYAVAATVASGLSGAARDRRRRTASRRRWRRATAGCRGCWRGRCCSAPTIPS